MDTLWKGTAIKLRRAFALLGLALCIMFGLVESLGDNAGLSAQQLIQYPDYKWQQTDGSLALLNHHRTVWQFNYGKDTRKPYFHPGP